MKELDAAEKSALIGQVRFPKDRQIEGVAIEAVGVGQPSHHDPDMMNASYHDESPPWR